MVSTTSIKRCLLRCRGRYPLLAPAALLLLAACAAPPPPAPTALPTGGAAIIRGGPTEEAYLFGGGHVTITRIDETALVDGDNNPLYSNVEVVAGSHAIYFNYQHRALCATRSACAMSLSRDRKLALDAQAGHVYKVGATYRDGRLWFWIADESDDSRVVSGGLPDGDDWAAGVQGLGGGQFF